MDTPSNLSPHQFAPAASLPKQFEWFARFYGRPAILTLLACWLFRNGCRTIQTIINYYTPLPTWDYWRVVFNLTEYRSFHLSILWVQHNEHRIVFPELVFAADMLLLHGRLILPLTVSFVCYFATWAVLSFPVYEDRHLPKSERLAAVALAGILVFWEGCANVLASPFLLQWTMMQFASACSFVCISRLQGAKSSLALLGVIVAATVATYSSGNALVLWPLLVLLAFCLRLSRSRLFALTSSALVNLTLYFVNYRLSGTLHIRNFFIHPLYAVEYVASYLSMPFGGVGTPAFGVAAGLFSILGTTALFLLAARTRINMLPPAVALFSYYVFTLLTALITAGGRMDPEDPRFVAAKVARYVTVPQMHWGVVVLLCLWIAWRMPSAKQAGNVLAFGFAVFLFLYLPKLTPWLADNADYFAEQQLETLSVENGLQNKDIFLKLYPNFSAVSAGLSGLQQLKLSVYYRFRGRWLGQPVRLFSPIRNSMPGAMTQVALIDSGLRVIGWADASAWNSPYRWVILTDESGTIIGFGSRFPAGFPRSVRSLANPSSLGWVGFIAERWRTKTIFAYIVGPRGNELFPLATPYSVPRKEDHSTSQEK